MWPVLLQVYSFKLTWFGLAVVLGLGITSFNIWKQTRADYPEEDVLFFQTMLALVVWISSYTHILLIQLLGASLFTVWWCAYKKWDVWEWIDKLGINTLVFGALVSLAYGPKAFILSAILFLGFAVTLMISKEHRGFSWYKSGKPGFVGLIALAFWLMIAVIQLPGSFYHWLWVAILTMVCVYWRSGRKAAQDIQTYVHKISTISARTRKEVSDREVVSAGKTEETGR
jgi:hypothetical protein